MSAHAAGMRRHARTAGEAGMRACSQPAAKSARNAQRMNVASAATGAGMPPMSCRLT